MSRSGDRDTTLAGLYKPAVAVRLDGGGHLWSGGPGRRTFEGDLQHRRPRRRERLGRADGCDKTRDGVGHGVGHEHRRIAGDVQATAHGRVVAEADTLRRGTRAPVAGDRHPVDTGRGERLRHDTELVHDPRPGPLDHEIRSGQQAAEKPPVVTIPEVDRDALLAVVQQIEERRRPVAGAVFATPSLDLDDPRACVGEQRRGERPRPQRAEVHDERPRCHLPDPPRGERSSRSSPRRTSGVRPDCETEERGPLDDLGGRHRPERGLDGRPVVAGDVPGDQGRERGDIVGAGKVERHPTVGGPDEPCRPTDRHRPVARHARDSRPLTEQSGPVDHDTATPPCGLRREIGGGGGHRPCQGRGPGQRRSIGRPGEGHRTAAGPTRKIRPGAVHHPRRYRSVAPSEPTPEVGTPVPGSPILDTGCDDAVDPPPRRPTNDPKEDNMVELKPGARFQSTVCTTEVIVVKGDGEADLTCGGAPMVPAGTGGIAGEPATDAADGTLLGKRYSDEGDTVELLATKAGHGSMAIGGTPLEVAQAKTLPASD